MKQIDERKTKSLLNKIVSIAFITFSLTLQFIFFYFLIFSNLQMFNYLNVLFTCIAFFVVIYIYNSNINASFKLTWVILILLFPLFGTLFFFFYGNGHSVPKRKSKIINNYLRNNHNLELDNLEFDKEVQNIIHGLCKTSHVVCYNNSNAYFYKDISDKYLALKEDLKRAKKYIFLEFFIIADGTMLDEIYEILFQKGNQGVKIYLLYDDVGSKATFSKAMKNKFSKIKNLKIKNYSPFGNSFKFTMNYRDHRKMIVIDGIYAYVGGDNLADEYIHKKIRFGFWRDNAIKIEGKAVNGFIKLFLEMWYISCKESLPIHEFINHEFNIINDNLIIPFGDGPIYEEHPSYSLFLNLIASAKETIYISTPYFIIDKEFINALCRAIKNGVKVKIITPSTPDRKSVFYLTREHYKNILICKGCIYEFSSGFNHAKNIIIDDKYAFIGTTNIDYRSFFLHFECGVILINSSTIEDMKDDFENTLLKCKEITYEKWIRRPFYQRAIAFLLSFFSPLF